MNTLRKDEIFYTLFTEHDGVSLEEAYALGKRDPQSTVKNRQWIAGKLARWRKKGLVEALYGPTGSLSGLRLTEAGKTLLGKSVEPDHRNKLTLSPADILDIVRQFKRAHPELEITFEIRLKEQRVLSSSTVNNELC
jgi:hypothetical protein